MSAPILNITFCGTNVEATRVNSGSLRATRQFEDHLILSGVGAPDCYDEKNDEHYPTPGTDRFDAQLKRHARSPWMNQHFSLIQRGSGYFWGEGERSNLSLAMKHVDRKMEYMRHDETVTVNLSGYSRGGAASIHFANMLYRQYGNRIRVNLFVIDPNAGLGRQNFQMKKHVPHNVDNMYVIFNKREKIPFFQSLNIPHYFFMNPKTSVTSLYVEGDHVEQDCIYNDKEELSAAKTNQHLLELFYDSYGAKRKQPASGLYSFKSNDFVKKGFVSSKAKETPLDIAIRDIQPSDEKFEPKPVEENTYFAQFNQEIRHLKDRNYSELSYYFAHLLSEIERGENKTPEEQEQAALILQATDNLISAMTPSKNFTKNQKQAALVEFQSVVRKGHYSDIIVQLAAHIAGLVTGILLGVTFGVCGFFAGFTRIDTLGLASIPYAAMGTYNGVVAGFEWGKNQVLGHQNERRVEKTVKQIISPKVGLDALIGEALEEAALRAKI
jgi:hypothetical protein